MVWHNQNAITRRSFKKIKLMYELNDSMLKQQGVFFCHAFWSTFPSIETEMICFSVLDVLQRGKNGKIILTTKLAAYRESPQSNDCWRALARQHTILVNREKIQNFVRCKTLSLRSRALSWDSWNDNHAQITWLTDTFSWHWHKTNRYVFNFLRLYLLF